MARILLADDDTTTLDLVGRTLEADGHEVIRCVDGQEALQRFSAAPESFNLLITDLDMPGINGVELASRAAAAAPQLRILVMSGFGGSADPAEDLGIPAAAFISKPLSLDQVREAVSSALA
ncbi:MAG: response regulator [Pseudomonadota bacterium]|jgi:DNA-binding NtrC family response regulator|nr:MAG: response regulator [Pseudomonadota bacterium]